MTDSDRHAAATALIAWFKSQDIMPGDAATIMSTVMAEQLVAKAGHDLDRLEHATHLMRNLLVFDIAEWLRR